MRKSVGLLVLTLGLLVLTGAGCFGTGGDPPNGNGTTEPGQAREVKFYNCNHTGDPFEPVSGRSYNMYSRVEDGPWVSQGGLNPQGGDWTDCHDEAHEGASLTVSIVDPAGKWEFRAIKLSLGEEPDCDSSAPEVDNACDFLTFIYHTDVEGPTVVEDVTSP